MKALLTDFYSDPEGHFDTFLLGELTETEKKNRIEQNKFRSVH